MFLWLIAAALAEGGAWWIEGPQLAERARAEALEQVAERAGHQARVVKRFRLGQGWEFVTLVEGFADEPAARAAATRLGHDGGVEFVLVHDPARGPRVRTEVAADAPARPGPGADALLDAARVAHGGPTGGAAALARAASVHFVFERQFSLDAKRVSVRHDYWREGASRRVDVAGGGFGSDSRSVATAKGAWVAAAGSVEVRDIGVVVGVIDTFAPEAILGVALDVHTLLAADGTSGLLVLEGAEVGRRVGRGEDPSSPGLAFVDIDPVTGRMAYVRYLTAAGPVGVSLSGWAEAAPGVVYPGKLEIERPDGRRETILVQRLEVFPTAPAGTFAAPETPPRP